MIEAKETLTGNLVSKQTINGDLNKTTEKVLPELEEITIIPQTERKVYTPENSYGYEKVTVEAMPPTILQTKEVTPTKEIQVITSDTGFNGLNQVTVNAIPNEYIVPNGTLDITENGTYDVKTYAEVTTNIESGGGGGKSIPIINSLTPIVHDYSGVTSVTTNATELQNLTNSSGQSAHDPSIVMAGIVTAFVRSDYTLSDNLTLIAETGWSDFTDGVTKQKGIVCWCDNINENFTITQASSGRMGIGIVCLELNPKPTITTIMNEHNYPVEPYTLPLKAGLTIYCVNSIGGSGYGFYELSNASLKCIKDKERSKLHSGVASERTKIYTYYVAEDCNSEFTRSSLSSIRSDLGWGVIGINLE